MPVPLARCARPAWRAPEDVAALEGLWLRFCAAYGHLGKLHLCPCSSATLAEDDERRRQQKAAFGAPSEYWAEYNAKEAVLILHFTLLFKKPIKAKSLEIDVYDPEFFINFDFDKSQPVTLVAAPPRCKAATDKPSDSNFPSLFFKLDPSMPTSEANIGMGASFANRIWVNRP
ncbi:MAG: DUF1007 family protein [Xanthobacteraceae bacterium]